MSAREKKMLNFIPIAYSFSELCNVDSVDKDEDQFFDFGEVRNDVEEKIDYEIFICQVLLSLNQEEKLVFLFQLLRNEGYKISKLSASRAINITVRKFIYLSKSIKKKVRCVMENNTKWSQKR
jgi:hypothetical protein